MNKRKLSKNRENFITEEYVRYVVCENVFVILRGTGSIATVVSSTTCSGVQIPLSAVQQQYHAHDILARPGILDSSSYLLLRLI